MTSTSPSLLHRLSTSADQLAWDRFVELYTPLLFHWCRQVGTSDSDAADLVQGVFVVLLEQLPKFQYNPTKSFRAWLKTILLNAWRNHLKKGSRHGSEPIDEERLASSASFHLFEDTEYRQELMRRALVVMEANFESKTWRACLEFVANGRPAEDVAQELGMTVNAVYLAKSRVLRYLRRELDGFWD